MVVDVFGSIEWMTLIHYLQIERGTTSLYLSSGGNTYVLWDLQTKRKSTDQAIDSVTNWLPSSVPALGSKEKLKSNLTEHRGLLKVDNSTVEAEIKYYSSIIEELIAWISESIHLISEESTLLQLVTLHVLTESKEQAGLERALGSTFFAAGGLDSSRMLWYAEKSFNGEAYLQLSMDYEPAIGDYLKSTYFLTSLPDDLKLMRGLIFGNNLTSASVDLGRLWFANMSTYIEYLKGAQDLTAQRILTHLAAYTATENTTTYLIMFATVLAVLLIPIVTALIISLMAQVGDFVHLLVTAMTKLKRQERKMEFVLNQLLPLSVVQKLLTGEKIPPVSYERVTIFFSDIVGFTTIASKSSAIEVVALLNSLYSVFDEIIESFDVYKVETIGDGYMVASGLPERNGDRHVTEIANMALRIRDAVSEFQIPHLPGHAMQLRIGIHTGSCVAAVVGSKMPRYCLFGDTVNTASRMESTGEAMRIQISDETHSMLRASGKYSIEHRGTIEVKGKGKMSTYWLVSRTDELVKCSNSQSGQTVTFHALFQDGQ